MTKQELLEIYEATPIAKAVSSAYAEQDLAHTAWTEAQEKFGDAWTLARRSKEWQAYEAASILDRRLREGQDD